MGLINPSRGVVDFDGFRALQPLFDAAKDAGIFIVLRPGPYINAETTAGGAVSALYSHIFPNGLQQESPIGPLVRLQEIFALALQIGKQRGRITSKASSKLLSRIKSQREDL